jgi:hypothetical protein
MSPFDFDDYADDSAVLTEIHPLAVYRRLVEPYVRRRAAQYADLQAKAAAGGKPFPDNDHPGSEVLKIDYKAWKNCMEKWEKEVAVREKEGVSLVHASPASFCQAYIVSIGKCYFENATRSSSRFLYSSYLFGQREPGVLSQPSCKYRFRTFFESV